MVAIFFLYIYVGLFGSNFWTTALFGNPKLTILQIFRVVFFISGILGILQSIYKVIVFKGENKRPLSEIITPWISMIGACAVFAVWTFGGPYIQSINTYHPRSVLLANGTIFANVVARLIICQMSHAEGFKKFGQNFLCYKFINSILSLFSDKAPSYNPSLHPSRFCFLHSRQIHRPSCIHFYDYMAGVQCCSDSFTNSFRLCDY